MSILLVGISFIDGSTRRLYHYVAYAFLNLGCSFYICNNVIVPEEGPDGTIETPMATLPVLNGRVRRASTVRRHTVVEV